MKKSIWAAALLTLSLASCQENETETIKIGYLPITHALPALTAAALQEEGDSPRIELVKFGSWTDLSDALNTGRIDGASVLVELAMKSREIGIGLKAVALGHTDGNVVIVAPGINSASDLRGKSFAIPHRQSSHYLLLNQVLGDAGLSVDDINIVELAPPDMPYALSSEQIAGYCVAEPFGAKAVDAGIGKVLFESAELWDHSLCCVLVLNEKYIEQHHKAAHEFVEAYKEAGEYIDSHREEVFELTREQLNIDKTVYDLSLRWISFDDLAIGRAYYDDLTRRVSEAGLSDTPPTYEEFIAPDLY
ncbi:MAG: ABC transporter substrate-binding protein [Rikenellaceae bacterium]|jgi:NitT/TauT family transport system substrate-binding protein|nr:ABC transporter substrate-binding protein [Rikenellaceae bacterium]